MVQGRGPDGARRGTRWCKEGDHLSGNPPPARVSEAGTDRTVATACCSVAARCRRRPGGPARRGPAGRKSPFPPPIASRSLVVTCRTASGVGETVCGLAFGEHLGQPRERPYQRGLGLGPLGLRAVRQEPGQDRLIGGDRLGRAIFVRVVAAAFHARQGGRIAAVLRAFTSARQSASLRGAISRAPSRLWKLRRPPSCPCGLSFWGKGAAIRAMGRPGRR